MRQPGVVLSRFELLESAWDGAYEDRSNVIDQHVRMLRERIGRRSIVTVRGRGYRLREGATC
jgi:two-component system, OmpR family, response regulator